MKPARERYNISWDRSGEARTFQSSVVADVVLGGSVQPGYSTRIVIGDDQTDTVAARIEVGHQQQAAVWDKIAADLASLDEVAFRQGWGIKEGESIPPVEQVGAAASVRRVGSILRDGGLIIRQSLKRQ